MHVKDVYKNMRLYLISDKNKKKRKILGLYEITSQI